MKHRNPIAVAVLGFITLGIYGLYWLQQTKQELTAKTKQAIPSIWWLILAYLAIIVPYVLFIMAALQQPAAEAQSGSNSTGLAFIGVLWAGILVMTVIHVIWFLKYSKAVSRYTKGEYNTAVSFLLLYLLGVIGMAIVQDKFNESADRPAVTGRTRAK